MTKNQIVLTLAGLIHLVTATELQTCIRTLSTGQPPVQPDPPPHLQPALQLGDNTCSDFSFLYGPTRRYCTGKYFYNDGVGIRGEHGSMVMAMFPFSEGEIIEIGEKKILDHSIPHILVKHKFTQDDCEFNGDRVTGIFIDYLHVEADDSLYVSYKYPQDSSYFPLGKLIHNRDCLCSNLRNVRHPEKSLVLRLHVEYESGEKSHPIPPAFLFEMSGDSLRFQQSNGHFENEQTLWHSSKTSREKYFNLGKDARFYIIGDSGCQSHYNEFHLKCEDTTSGEGIEGQYEHTIKLDDPEKMLQRKLDTDYTSHNPHLHELDFSYSQGFYLPYILPGGINGKMWDGVHLSCSVRCNLSVYDVTGKSMGSFSFVGASSEHCPDGPLIAPAMPGPAMPGHKKPKCTKEKKVCPDGFTTVRRDPENGCEYFPCPPLACTKDAMKCPGDNDIYVSRDPKNGCKFKPCPKSDMSDETNDDDDGECPNDTKLCPDKSTTVGRDPDNECEYFPCPPVFCTEDAMLCPGFDDIWVGRDPDNNCEFKPCPPPEDGNESIECPCSSSIQNIDAEDTLSENSCKLLEGDDCQTPSYVAIWIDLGDREDVYHVGSDARIDEDNGEGSCADGDAISIISVEEAEACVKEIVDHCETVGYPVCTDDDS